jgi:diaminopimelate epimerase
MKNIQKYSANGNDFIILDSDFGQTLNRPQIKLLCHRKNGIGADGLMFATSSDDANFRMHFYNSDGSEGQMCGNGARALTHYVMTSTSWSLTQGAFIAGDGRHQFRIENNHQVWVEILTQGGFTPHNIQGFRGNSCKVGVDHLVVPTQNLKALDINKIGKALCFDPAFPKQINVNFIEASNGSYQIRTFERGVFAETDACGTGATAAAKYLESLGNNEWPKSFEFKGGTLYVNKNDGRYWLSGDINFLFDATLGKDILADSKQLGNE